MFPRSIVPLFVGREASIKAIENAVSTYDKKIFLVAQRTPETEKPQADGPVPHGHREQDPADAAPARRHHQGPVRGPVPRRMGSSRTAWKASRMNSPLPAWSAWRRTTGEGNEAEALVRTSHEAMEHYGRINKKLAPETILAINAQTAPGRLADAIMPHLKVDYIKKQEILEQLDPVKRLEDSYALLQGEIEISSIEKKIKGRVKQQMEKNQREYYLNEQLKAIHKEMGRDEDPLAEVAEFELRLKEKDMPDEAREKAMRELKKMKHTPPSSAEYTVVRNYVEWILDLPWNVLKDVKIDVNKAKEILDADHYGLEKPKERILEYLAVQSLVEKMKGPILCLVGPPGVGKTSLAKSIARAMDREFVRLSLGGVRDEAEIRGHRRTYVGALPGKIIQSLKSAVKFNNPVFCLDEVDKMSTDFRGDPSSAPCWKCSTRSRTTPSATTTWTWTTTCPRCSSSPRPTPCTPSPCRCRTAWRSSAFRATWRPRSSPSPSSSCCPRRSRRTA